MGMSLIVGSMVLLCLYIVGPVTMAAGDSLVYGTSHSIKCYEDDDDRRWYYNDKDTGRTGENYNLQHVTFSDEGVYECRVRDYPVVSKTITVFADLKPSFVTCDQRNESICERTVARGQTVQVCVDFATVPAVIGSHQAIPLGNRYWTINTAQSESFYTCNSSACWMWQNFIAMPITAANVTCCMIRNVQQNTNCSFGVDVSNSFGRNHIIGDIKLHLRVQDKNNISTNTHTVAPSGISSSALDLTSSYTASISSASRDILLSSSIASHSISPVSTNTDTVAPSGMSSSVVDLTSSHTASISSASRDILLSSSVASHSSSPGAGVSRPEIIGPVVVIVLLAAAITVAVVLISVFACLRRKGPGRSRIYMTVAPSSIKNPDLGRMSRSDRPTSLPVFLCPSYVSKDTPMSQPLVGPNSRVIYVGSEETPGTRSGEPLVEQDSENSCPPEYASISNYPKDTELESAFGTPLGNGIPT